MIFSFEKRLKQNESMNEKGGKEQIQENEGVKQVGRRKFHYVSLNEE